MTLLVVLALPFATGSAQAQTSSCPYANLRFESVLAVDANRICEAAAPWSEKGFRVLVYLTDARDLTENAWFERIDRVEAEAGLRDLSQADFYDRNGLTLAASTDTTLPWGFNITYGETLYGTRLDTSDREYERIRTNVRYLLRQGDPSQALVTGLTESYALAYPPPTSRWLLESLGIGGGAAIGSVIYLSRQRRRKQLQNQIQALQASVATLLLALEHLLPSEKAEEMILYRLYLGLGGDRYPHLRSQILNTLQKCRRSLTQAFLVQGQLSDQTATTLPELEQQVEAWERLYVSLVGSREHLLNLTEEQLQTLLNPVQFLPSDQRQGSLSHQLEDLRQQLEGRPLKVTLLRVDPKQLDTDGILGLIDQIHQDLNRLQTAPTRLPAQLATLGNLLRRPPARIPVQQLAGLLRQAQALRQNGLDLDGLELVEAGIRCVEVLAQIQTWREQGYRFPKLATELAQLQAALGSLLQVNPGQLASAIPSLQKAIDALDNHSRAHVQQHQKNQAELSQIQTQLQTLSCQRLPDLERRIAKASRGWRMSGIRFPLLDEDLNAAKQLLFYVEQEGIPAIQRWNSLSDHASGTESSQQFERAEQEINRVKASLQRCQETLDRIEKYLRQIEQESYDYDRSSDTVVVVKSEKSTWRTPSKSLDKYSSSSPYWQDSPKPNPRASKSSGMHSSSSPHWQDSPKPNPGASKSSDMHSSSSSSWQDNSSRDSSGGSSRRR
ncbi:MAG: hypothetical protein SNJ85_00640 [Cyanobacteriota bacterium]